MKRTCISILIFIFAVLSTVGGSVFADTNAKTDLFTFESSEIGDPFEETDAYDLFSIAAALETTTAKVAGTKGDQYMELYGYVSLKSFYEYKKAYTVSADLGLVSGDTYAFFVRGVEPGALIKEMSANPAMIFEYYEYDYYDLEGGTDGPGGLGAAGISVSATGSGIKVTIKNYKKDGLNIGNSVVNFPLPAGSSAEKYNVKVEDDFSSVRIYIDSALLCTVELSGKEMTYEEDNDHDYTYYQYAVIKDAAGAEKLKVENTRISYGTSQIGIGCRGTTKIKVDNLSVTAIPEEEAPVTEPTGTPGATESPGAATDKTTPAKTTQKATAGNAETKPGSGNIGIYIIVGIGIIVVTAAVVTIIIIRKKKKRG